MWWQTTKLLTKHKPFLCEPDCPHPDHEGEDGQTSDVEDQRESEERRSRMGADDAMQHEEYEGIGSAWVFRPLDGNHHWTPTNDAQRQLVSEFAAGISVADIVERERESADDAASPASSTRVDRCPRCGRDLAYGGELGHWGWIDGVPLWCEPEPEGFESCGWGRG